MNPSESAPIAHRLKLEKDRVEEEIKKVLDEFTASTGLQIDRLSLDYYRAPYQTTTSYHVEMEVKL